MIAQYKNDFFSRQHFSLNIGSEVLRLQDFAQIILKFSWGGKPPQKPPLHIGPLRYFSGQWNFEGSSKFFFLSRPLYRTTLFHKTILPPMYITIDLYRSYIHGKWTECNITSIWATNVSSCIE